MGLVFCENSGHRDDPEDVLPVRVPKSECVQCLRARVAELEASLQDFVGIEPDGHQESMSYFPPHKEGCIWCHAKRLLGLI